VRVVVGRSSMAESAAFTADAAGVLRTHLDDARFLVAVRRGNVRGALDMGLAPGMLPGRVTLDAGRSPFASAWPTVPSATGLDTAGILQAAADGRIRTLVLIGADPLGDFCDRDLARRALESVDTVIACDTVLNASSAMADVVLPAAGFSEVSGTTTNLEGRISVLNQKVTPPGTSRSDWIIAAEVAMTMGVDLGLESTDDIWAEVARLAPSHSGITGDLLASSASGDGVVAPLAGAAPSIPTVQFTPGQTEPLAPRDAYSLRLVASRKLYDQGVAVATSPAMAALPPGSVLRVNRYDFDRLGVAEGDTVRLTSPRTSVNAVVVLDTTLPRGSVGVWFNQPGICAADLVDASSPVTTVQVETLGSSGAAS